jgi:glycosyltransferase involved in cell wall biosynthesis
MPVYNAARYLDEALASVLGQRYSAFELLIWDDGSTDSSPEIVRALVDRRVRVLEGGPHLGYLRASNRLLEAASGELLAFQDADDFSSPDRLDSQVAAFAADPNLGICGTWARLIDAKGRQLSILETPVEDAEIRKQMYERNPFLGPSIMIRAGAYRAIGGRREAFEGYSHQDYDWASRVVDRFGARNVPDLLYTYRQHGTSNSKQVNVKRAIGHLLARDLARQRRDNGADALDRGDTAGFEALVAKHSAPYLEDVAWLDRDYAGRFLWEGFPSWAIRHAWAAVRKSPRDLRNYRALAYCLRHALAAPWAWR